MGLFGSGEKSKRQVFNLQRVMNSSAGVPIPILYGTDRVIPNFVWAGNFITIPPPSGKKFSLGGKAAPNFSTYSLNVALALAQGQVQKLKRVWESGGAGLNNRELADADSALLWTLYTGTSGQAPASIVTSVGGLPIGFSTLGYVAQANWLLGGSAQPPQVSFELAGILAQIPLNAFFWPYPYDAPVDGIVADILTNPVYGAGVPTTMIGQEQPGHAIQGFYYYLLQDLWAYANAGGFYFSPLMDTSRPIADWLQEWFEICNVDMIFASEAFYVIPYAEKPLSGPAPNIFFPFVTYTPNVTPVRSFTDNDYITKAGEAPIKVNRGLAIDRYNEIKVRYKERTSRYDTRIQSAKLQTSIDVFQVRPADVLQYDSIKTAPLARTVAQLRLQRLNATINSYVFTVAPNNIDLDPMDIIAISDSTIGLNAYPVRIKKIEENETLDLVLTCEDIFPATTALYPTQAPAGGTGADAGASPGSINPPIIYEPPFAVTGGARQIWFVGSGAPGSFGGANVWMSTDGGTTYQRIGSIVGNNAQGVLLTTLPSGSDPDITDTLQVDESLSGGTFTTISHAQADLFLNLAVIDQELISFATATAAAQNQWNLTYLRRGIYGTTIASHAIGAGFGLLGAVGAPANGVFIYTVPATPDLTGKTLYFKFTAFNVLGANEQDISTVTAYTHSFTGTGALGSKSISIAYTPVPTANQVIFSQTIGVPIKFPVNLNGSFANLAIAATGTTVYTLKKNGTAFGTWTVAPSGTTGTFAAASATQLNASDVLTLVAQATPDATAAGLTMTLVGS